MFSGAGGLSEGFIKSGFNPIGIARKLRNDYELWVYPGDIYSWLDALIHNLKAVQRIAVVGGLTDIDEEIDLLLAEFFISKQKNGN